MLARRVSVGVKKQKKPAKKRAIKPTNQPLRSFEQSPAANGGGYLQKSAYGGFLPPGCGSKNKKPGDTYFRGFTTIIGSKRLAFVFGKGTRVSTWISSPEVLSTPCSSAERIKFHNARAL